MTVQSKYEARLKRQATKVKKYKKYFVGFKLSPKETNPIAPRKNKRRLP